MKTAIIYAYYETAQTLYNLDFFVKVGLVTDEDYVYVFVINGEACGVTFPEQKNLIVIRRENIGFDFGGHKDGIDYLLRVYQDNLPTNFIFINGGVIGPFLPAYFNKDKHWSDIFTSKINSDVKLVGTSIVCLPHRDQGGFGPKVESFIFCLDKVGLDLVLANGTIFRNHPTKQSAILNGEYALSKLILHHGYNLDCLLYKYSGIDWKNKDNWKPYDHPSRSGSYDGISIHPFEVVFHKWFWSYAPNSKVSFDFVDKYKKWKYSQLNLS